MAGRNIVEEKGYGENNSIMQNEAEIYEFGIKQMLNVCLNVITTISIGVIMGQVLQSIVLLISFMMLRTYAGGLHASTPARCYLLTIITIIVSLSVINNIKLFQKLSVLILILSDIVIWKLAPVGTANKTLDEIECIVYRKKTIIVVIVENIVAGICIGIHCLNVVYGIIAADMIVALSVICGCLSEKYKMYICSDKIS